MIGMGMYEILVILGLLGGGVGGLPMQPLEAPRDTVWEATAHLLPGAHVALHGNLEHAWDQMEGLLEEVAGLRLVKNSPSALQGLAMARAAIVRGAAAGQAEVGLDFRKDLGSVTISVRSDGPEQVQVLVRARGNFGSDRLAAALGSISGETEVYKGVTLHGIPERDLPAHVICLADETTALLGPVAVVKRLLDGDALAEADPSRDILGAALRRRGVRALLWGGALVDRPGAFLYLAPPPWLVDTAFKERELRHAAAALQGLRSMTHVSVFGRGTLTFDATSEMTGAVAAHACYAASRLNAATDPLVDAALHIALAAGPLLPAEEVGAEVVAALTDAAGLREAVDWFRRRMLTGGGGVRTEPGTHRVEFDVDSPMGLTSLLMPLTGSLGWLLATGRDETPMPAAAVAPAPKPGMERDRATEGKAAQEPMRKDPGIVISPAPPDEGAAEAEPPLNGSGIPTAVPAGAKEPNRRDLDPGG